MSLRWKALSDPSAKTKELESVPLSNCFTTERNQMQLAFCNDIWMVFEGVRNWCLMAMENDLGWCASLAESLASVEALQSDQANCIQGFLLIRTLTSSLIREGSGWSHFKDHSLDHLWPMDFNLLLSTLNSVWKSNLLVFTRFYLTSLVRSWRQIL